MRPHIDDSGANTKRELRQRIERPREQQNGPGRRFSVDLIE
jgi:hypothetical protein